jgi:hypothetical protein
VQIDSLSLGARGKKIPENVHTVFRFKLPFPIPIPDGLYEISLSGKKADLVIKRVQRQSIEGFSAKGYAQLKYDKYGRSSFSSISITFRCKIDVDENGRTPLILGEIPPRRKSKETVIRFLNRFIDTVKFATKEFWVQRARYQDLSSYSVEYWDGKNLIPIDASILDTGVGGLMIGSTPPFQVEKQVLEDIQEILSKETPLDSSSMLFLNSKDSCLQEDFRLAIVEAVAGLEVVLYNFIRVKGKMLQLSNEELDDFIIKVGLTGNITMVLRMLTQGIEQIDDSILRDCRGAIKIRNKILHEGFQDVGSTDTEKRVIAIGKMIDYLKRITPS